MFYHVFPISQLIRSIHSKIHKDRRLSSK